MKNMKRVIAIVLAILMVTFSVPFTALADDEASGIITAYTYNSNGTWGWRAGADPVSSFKAGDTIAVVFGFTGSDYFGEIFWDVATNPAKLQYGYYNNGTWQADKYNTTGLRSYKGDLLTAASGKGVSVSNNEEAYFGDSFAMSNAAACSFGDHVDSWDSLKIMWNGWECGTEDGPDGEPGIALTGTTYDSVADVTLDYTLVQVQAFKCLTDMTYEEFQAAFDFNDDINTVLPYEGADEIPLTSAFAPASVEPQPTGVTYKPINGAAITVTDGSTPALTATAYTSNNNGTHNVTTYSWVADTTGEYDFVETASTQNNVQCQNYNAGTAAIHTQEQQVNGTSASWNCALCGSSKAAETISAAHTYNNAGAVTAVAATCTVAAHNHYVCDVCGAESDGDFTGNALGHNYTYAWSWANDNSTATITATCQRDTSHTDKEENIVAVTSEATQGGKQGTLYTVTSTKFAGQSDQKFVPYGDITVRYIAADGTQVGTDQTVPVGQAPTVPATNTETAYAENGDGTHNKTEYSWPAATPVAQTPAVVIINEVPNVTENIPCTMEDVAGTAITGTCTVEGRTADTQCSVCGYLVEGQSTGYGEHTGLRDVPAVTATCTVEGFTAGQYCDDCNTWITEPQSLGYGEHTGLRDIPAVTATCVTEGFTAGQICDTCNTYITEPQSLGYDANNHEAAGTPVAEVPATRGTDGCSAYTHYDCCGADVGKVVIPATGVNITVLSSDLGTVKVNDTVAGDEAVNVAYKSTYTLTAEPVGDNVFVGWMVGDKFVSRSETYTTAAFADMTYTAVFENPAAAEFNITFVDVYGNVLAEYTNAEAAGWTEIPEIACPFQNYSISGYDKTIDDIKVATEATTVTVTYEKSTTADFTVTAEGATITVDGVEYQNTATVTTYDAYVTVSNDNAKVWSVNGKVAGYGDSYSFYITTSVVVTFTEAAVDETPVVAAINGNGDVVSADGIDVRFLASRNVPDGYKVVESGFIYGKELTEAELDLDKVGTTSAAGTKIKIYKNSNTANEGQFSLTYGVTAMTTASARAYLITSHAGTTEVWYADPQIHVYS